MSLLYITDVKKQVIYTMIAEDCTMHRLVDFLMDAQTLQAHIGKTLSVPTHDRCSLTPTSAHSCNSPRGRTLPSIIKLWQTTS